ncbi:MAG: SCO family protein [Proteobacteria bacterium]|nr:SCO family protein [Pseudomonadota bacterium]
MRADWVLSGMIVWAGWMSCGVADAAQPTSLATSAPAPASSLPPSRTQPSPSSLRTPQSSATDGATDGRLIDQDGHRVGPAELDGHWLLIYFGYANCPDLCPASLLRQRQILDELGAPGETILPLFVSVDPQRDTQAVLKAFAAHFHPRLRALTGSQAAVMDAARTFGVPVKRDGGRLDHGVFLYLAAPDGRVVAVLHPEQPLAANLRQVRAALAARHP